jgi:hypothetical protein
MEKKRKLIFQKLVQQYSSQLELNRTNHKIRDTENKGPALPS